MPKSAKAEKTAASDPEETEPKKAAKASTEQPLRSDAGVRPRDVDDRKVSLEDRLRDGFMAAYHNRVGETPPNTRELNA